VSPRGLRAAATLLALLALALVAASGLLLVRDVAASGVALTGNSIAALILASTFTVVGWLITFRRHENRLGWMVIAVGVVFALVTFSGVHAHQGLVVEPGSLPFADVTAWLSTLAWVPAWTLVVLLLLLYPEGRLPSRRWRPILWIAAASAALMLVPSAIAEWPYRGPALLADAWPSSPVLDTALLLQGAGLALSVVVAVAGAAALVTRFRRSAGLEHQQIKWFASAAVVEVCMLFVLSGPGLIPRPFDFLAAIIAGPLIPIAIGIAILRYHLYEIDRIISRTISWTLTTGAVGAVFVGIVVGLQGIMAQVTGANTVAVAGSTLVAAAIFQPLRRRVQGAVDHRFNRARYDAQRTVDGFAEQLRYDVDLGTLRSALASTVEGAVHPISSIVWLRNVVASPPTPIS
jgi:hypothetical protein